MVSRCLTVAFQGITAVPVDVQVMVGPGQMGMHIVGLADKAVAESRERVQAALHASGLSMPTKRVTVNLAPADLPKEGSHYDLPIALALMAAIGALPGDALDGYVVMGELALDGTIAPVTGALPAAMGANGWDKGLICPAASGSEAAWADPDMDVLAPRSLIAMANHFKGTQVLQRPVAKIQDDVDGVGDMADIRGQETAKRAIEIAAAGGHNLLLVGPPGSGKSMLASRLPGILPPLTPKELLDVSMINSIAGTLADGKLSSSRPFRAPHHSASMAAMVGGGLRARPGEVSLAHNGVLFLDEFPEFTPQVLDSLRQPLESGETVIARANHRVSYPSRLQLVAAMNPCRCGMAGEPGHVCRRGKRCASDYQSRISGPLMDRIDLRIEVPAVRAIDLFEEADAEPSAVIAQRVAAAQARQTERHASLGLEARLNAHLPNTMVEKLAQPDGPGLDLLR
ncbi:MAG: YifB family Mg chelatase-like AAA ATPase, partial [Pseudomonadota bacterium]